MVQAVRRVADEALLARPPLTGCAARFLTGFGPVAVRGSGVGDPCLRRSRSVFKLCSTERSSRGMFHRGRGRVYGQICLHALLVSLIWAFSVHFSTLRVLRRLAVQKLV